ncbi:MAG: pyridoxamine 5'-phosphate oxidase family protein [Smithellaceae bacterium]|nr:pyridoxamine 5'-phosphate oxidase family protein [Smithellaceae bacterium]
MKKAEVPKIKMTGKADVKDRLAALSRAERFGVLATQEEGAPYLSLVAFALTPEGDDIVFATPADTRKYCNVRRDTKVSLLIDNRAGTIMANEALAIKGTARLIRRGKTWDRLAKDYVARHPELGGFIKAPTTRLVAIEIEECIHVDRFQYVTSWRRPQKRR